MPEYEISDGIAEDTFEFVDDTEAVKNIHMWFDSADWHDWKDGSLILLDVKDMHGNDIASQWFKFDKDKDQWFETTETE